MFRWMLLGLLAVGASITPANSAEALDAQYSHSQCDCADLQEMGISEVCKDDKDDRCSCINKDCDVSPKEPKNTDTAATEIASFSSSAQPKNSNSDVPGLYTPATTTATTTATTATTTTTTPIIPISTTYYSKIDVSSGTTEKFSTSIKIKTLIFLLLFMVVVFIIFAVFLYIRKRKLDKRNDWSPVAFTSQGETVTNVYADNGPSLGTAPAAGNHIYDELDMMTLDPTPSNVYAEVQPTSVAVDMGRSVDYVDIDLPIKDQQKPMNSSKAADLSLSPVYSQPFESQATARNTEYAEPFKTDTTNAATAPVLNHNSTAAGDQQNDVYSLAKAIPLNDANVIYSQPNKPTKSLEPTCKANPTDPIHSEAIGVKPGAGSGGVVAQDPNAVYAETMKPKKPS